VASEPLFDLEDKVSVVTGGSRGIGRAVAEGLAAAGSDVVIASRKLDACTTAATEIATVTGRVVLPYAAHVGQWEACAALLDFVWSEFGRCDVLVNNAGISPPYADLGDVTEALWEKVHAVNSKGPFRLGVLAAQRMRADGGGAIVNVSSGATRQPEGATLVYAMSKAGLECLTAGLVAAYGPSVRANTVVPGPTETGMLSQWKDSDAGRSIGRVGHPSDFVGTCIFLASDASLHVSGSTIIVN
jgi:hypothetical protein